MQCVQIEQDKNKVNQSSKTHNSGKDPAEKAKTVKGDRFLWPNVLTPGKKGSDDHHHIATRGHASWPF